MSNYPIIMGKVNKQFELAFLRSVKEVHFFKTALDERLAFNAQSFKSLKSAKN